MPVLKNLLSSGREHRANYRHGTRQESTEGAFPGGPVVKTSSSNAGEMGLIPGWGAETSTSLGAKSKT